MQWNRPGLMALMAAALPATGDTAPSLPLSADAAPAWRWSVSGAATAGIGVRASAQSPYLRPGGGNNGDDGDLNYARGDVFSAVLKGTAWADLTRANGDGLAIAAMAWHDDNLLHHGVLQGNIPNRYVPGAALSDAGFDRDARFQGANLLYAYAHGGGGTAIAWRAGLIAMDSGAEFSFPGGLRNIEIRNQPGASRPGALPGEGAVPFWGGSAQWRLAPSLQLYGYWQLRPEHSVSSACGTFWSSADYRAAGCDKVFYANKLTQQQYLDAGAYFGRGADLTPARRPDEGGLGLRYDAAPLATRFTAFLAHYSARDSFIDSYKANKLGPASGGQYVLEYPANLNLFALATHTDVQPLSLSWSNELSVTSGQPLQINSSELLAASLGAGGLMGPVYAAAPDYSLIRGYDRYRVVQAQTRVQRTFAAWGALARPYLAAEAGLKHVNGLAGVDVRHYDHPENSTTCITAAACATQDGYATGNAWAYRVSAGADIDRPLPLLRKLRLSLAYAHDVRGWSYDYAFIQGRQAWRLGLDATLPYGMFAGLNYTATHGGLFNARRDRDYLLLSIGRTF